MLWTRGTVRRHGRLGQFRTAGPVWMCVALVTVFAGCATHDARISLSEFLQMQSRSGEDQQATDQSQEAGAEARSIDEYLRRHRVGPFDVLAVTLTGLDNPTQSTVFRARVDQNGEIDLPLVGGVKVADLELPQVEDAIKSAYVPNIVRQLTANVTMEEYQKTAVIVVGAATAPGLVSLRRTERNLLFAMVDAGGFSSSASGLVTLRRLREPEEVVSFDLTDPIQLEAALRIDPLEQGDIVVVEAAQPNTIFVGGLVNDPRPQIYPMGVEMSVSQVLAAAGGLRTDVTPDEATLVRRMPDGTYVHVKLNVRRIIDGRDQNIMLAAGDILWVPETLRTKIQDFVNRNIFLRAGVTITYNVTGVEFLNRPGLQSGRFGGGTGGTLQDQFDPLGFLAPGSATPQILTTPR